MAPTKQSAVSAPFNKDERVLCFHHEMLYEAKILDSRPTEDGQSWQYRIHYKGWKKTWDDWVPQDRVRKFTDENKELAAQLISQMKVLQQKTPKSVANKKGGRANGSDFSSTRGSEERHASIAAQGARGPRRHRDYDLEQGPKVTGLSKASPRTRCAKAGSPVAEAHILTEPKRNQRHAKVGAVAITPQKVSKRYGVNNLRPKDGLARVGRPKKIKPDNSFSSQDHQSKRETNCQPQEDSFHARPSIKLVIPDHIKSILVDDWENVTKNQQLVPLPSEHPVNSILATYLESEMPKRIPGSAHADILEEVVAGLKEYFEKCLGRILLYRFERDQYIEMHEMWNSNKGNLAGKGPGDVYGAEHLARLLVSLPELIAQTNMDIQSVNRLREELSKLANWLGKNALKYFVSEYEAPSQAYVEKARGA